ncbi:hypothetical protein N9850_09600, partial [Granulosicoccus sp.]
MQFSTVQRERLISPINLALMAGLFAISFVFLKPTSVPGSLQGLEPNLGAASQVDELGVAYLKALRHSGDIDEARVIDVVRTLMRDGRSEEVIRFLQDNPDVQLSDELRFELDMEMSAGVSDGNLYALLEKLLATPAWQTEALLERATVLSQQLQHPSVSNSLYSAWARSTERAAGTSKDIHVYNIYKQCGLYFTEIAETHRAMTCYQNAIDALPERFSAFDIHIGMLRSTATGSADQNDVIHALLSDETLDVAKMDELATVLLAVERAEFAAPVYAGLAEKDPDKAVHWYGEAARWAEA